MKHIFTISLCFLALSISVYGQNNYSMSFDGVDDYVSVNGMGGTYSTFSFLTKARLVADNFNQSLFYFGQESTSNNSTGSIDLTIDDINYDPAVLRINLNFDNGSVEYQPLTLNSWVDVAGVFDGVNQMLYMYIEGQLVSSTSTTVSEIVLTNNDSHKIGAGFASANQSIANFFNGDIYNLAFFDKTLSQQEIQQYMNCPPSGDEAGLVGYWNFDEGSGTTAFDQTAHGNDGTINGATWSTDVPEQNCQSGCTDALANNFNPEATLDDGTCCYLTIAQNDTTICEGDSLTLFVESANVDTSYFTEQWHNAYPPNVGLFGKGLVDNGSLIISGAYWPTWPGGTTDQMITKIDTNGTLLWQNIRSPGGDHDSYNSVGVLNGNYIFFGQQNAQGTSYFDGFWTVFNQDGIELNYGNIDMPGSTSGTDMKLLANGNIVFTGPDGNNAYVRLVDPNFNTLNHQSYSVGGWNGAKLEIAPDSNYIFAVSSMPNINVLPLIKYDLSLNQVADYSVNMNYGHVIKDIKIVDNHLYLVGHRVDSGNNYGVLYKYNFSGVLLESYVESSYSSYTSITEVNGEIIIAKSNLNGTSPTSCELLHYLGSGLFGSNFILNNGAPFIPNDLISDQDYIYVPGVDGSNYAGITAVSKVKFSSNTALSSSSTFLWSTGDATETITVTPTQTTTYWIEQTENGATCTDEVTITVQSTGCGNSDACNFTEGDACDIDCVFALFENDCNAGAVACGEGTVWDADAQECIVANPTDTNFDGCTDLNDLLDILSAYGDCAVSGFTCGDLLEYQGYDYETVQIGEQCWFADNLRSELYANGDAILNDVIGDDWEDLSTGASAIYGESDGCEEADYFSACNPDESLDAFGRLYNWFAVDDVRGVCPVGWRVPTDDEWFILENTLGGGNMADEALKTTYGWNSDNGTNSSGFSAIPSGKRDVPGGDFIDAGNIGGWWSSTENGTSAIAPLGYAWTRLLNTTASALVRSDPNKKDGYSVRCIKD